MNPLLLLGGFAAGGALLLANTKARAKGSLGSGPAGHTFVVGPSGASYAVSMAEGSAAGQLHAVHNTELELLFTYVQKPNGVKQFVAAQVDVEPGELAKALSDFNVNPR